MNRIVTTPLKNEGLAAFLAFLPFGLFYSSILGGVVMYFIVPTLLLLSLFNGIIEFSFILISIPIFYIVCFLWALIAVRTYNKTLLIFRDGSSPSLKNYAFKDQSDISDRKNEINQLTYLHSTGVISDEVFNKRKGDIEILLQSNPNTISENQLDKSETHRSEPKTKKVFIWPALITIALILIAVWISNHYQLVPFDRYSNERKEIKEQIEYTYFGVLNGAFTAKNIQGLGPEGLPFYNFNMKNAVFMGMVPFATLFADLKWRVDSIDVYHFLDDQNAWVNYNLYIEMPGKSVSTRINMLMKKLVGIGNWTAREHLVKKRLLF